MIRRAGHRTKGTPKRLLTQSFLLSLEYVLGSTWALVTAIFAMRLWGPETSGLLAQAQTLISVLAVLATLGLETTLVKHLIQEPHRVHELMGCALRLRLYGNLLLAIVAALCAWCAGLTAPEQIIVIALTFAGQLVQTLIIDGFRFTACGDPRPVVVANIVLTSLFGLARLVMLANGCSVYGFQASIVAEALTRYLLTRRLSAKRFGPTQSTWNPALARGLIRESAALAAGSFVVTAFMKIDIVIVSTLLPLHEVGIYSAAVRIIETYMTAIAVLFSLGLVWLTESYANSKEYQRRLSKLFRIGFVVSLACMLLNLLVGKPVFHWLLGASFDQSVDLACLLSVSILATTSGTIRSFAFSLEGKNIFHLWSALIGLGFGVPLTIAVTVQMGLEGTAMVVCCCYFISAVATSLIFPSLRTIGRMQLLLPPHPDTFPAR